MPDNRGRGPVGQLHVRHRDRIHQPRCDITEAGTQNHGQLRRHAATPTHDLGGGLDTLELSGLAHRLTARDTVRAEHSGTVVDPILDPLATSSRESEYLSRFPAITSTKLMEGRLV